MLEIDKRTFVVVHMCILLLKYDAFGEVVIIACNQKINKLCIHVKIFALFLH